MTDRSDPDPEARDAAYGSADSVFGYGHESPEQRFARRTRNVSVIVAVVAVIALLVLLVLGFALLAVLHGITSTL